MHKRPLRSSLECNGLNHLPCGSSTSTPLFFVLPLRRLDMMGKKVIAYDWSGR